MYTNVRAFTLNESSSKFYNVVVFLDFSNYSTDIMKLEEFCLINYSLRSYFSILMFSMQDEATDI